MTKTLMAFAFFGLTAVGLAGCGSGDDTADLVSDMCNKMDSCDLMMGMTVSECKKLADPAEGEEATSAEKEAARKCLSKSCEEFATCINGL